MTVPRTARELCFFAQNASSFEKEQHDLQRTPIDQESTGALSCSSLAPRPVGVIVGVSETRGSKYTTVESL